MSITFQLFQGHCVFFCTSSARAAFSRAMAWDWISHPHRQQFSLYNLETNQLHRSCLQLCMELLIILLNRLEFRLEAILLTFCSLLVKSWKIGLRGFKVKCSRKLDKSIKIHYQKMMTLSYLGTCKSTKIQKRPQTTSGKGQGVPKSRKISEHEHLNITINDHK